MADFKTPNEFRKGSLLRKLNEDPTYLSFFFVFDDQARQESPLFAGAAHDYLTKVLNTEHSKKFSDALENFKKVLMKINKEMPWFWQNLSGLDAAMTYGDMKEPWWGSEKPKLEIECLEENVELTAIGLMDLYKRAAFDFERWVEVIPRNLRHFRMQVWVSEVRAFQQDTDAKDLNFYGKGAKGGNVTKINEGLSLSAKPFIQLQFSHCEWDIDSIAPMFADLSKNPEAKKPKIGIKWGAVQQISQKLGANIEKVQEDKFDGVFTDPSEDGDYSPFDPQADDKENTKPNTRQNFKDTLKDATLGKIGDAAKDALGGIEGRINSAKNSLTLQNNSTIGNVHGGTTGLASTLVNRAEDAIMSRLLLGNVHGVSGGSLLDAVQAGSINAIANQLGGLFGGSSNSGPSSINENIHPVGVDSSPDGFLNYRIHDPGVDSSPDGNLNDNVHE
jgi:hypothetical protein